METSLVDPRGGLPPASACADPIDVRYSGSMAVIFYCTIQSWHLLFLTLLSPELVNLSLPLGDGSAPII